MRAREGEVRLRGRVAGRLTETVNGYEFVYDAHFIASPKAVAISLTLPLRAEPYRSRTLFPFFQNLLAEGITKRAQCRKLRLDERDHFGRLLATAADDVVGAVTVQPLPADAEARE